jgi:osmotically-inducible protein OsmY
MRLMLPFQRNSYQPVTIPKQRKKSYAPVFTLFLASALSGCATFHKCQSDACSNDAKIATDVQTTFQHHAELEAPNRVRVQTMNQVVYLTGRVSEGLQREEAESIAHETPGVTRVVNSITVDH